MSWTALFRWQRKITWHCTFVSFDENKLTHLWLLRVMVSCLLLLRMLGKHLKIKMSRLTDFTLGENSPQKVKESSSSLIQNYFDKHLKLELLFESYIYLAFFTAASKQSGSVNVKGFRKGRQQTCGAIFYQNLTCLPAAILCWELEVISNWTQHLFPFSLGMIVHLWSVSSLWIWAWAWSPPSSRMGTLPGSCHCVPLSHENITTSVSSQGWTHYISS